MALKVHHEPGSFANERAESCCMCRRPTRYWHKSDVALCPSCAEETNRADLPTKREWFMREWSSRKRRVGQE